MARSSAKADRPPRPYGGLAPDERRRERRERLMQAGLSLFGTQGYAKTSIERLCVEAAVATRHYYEEFATREALFKAVYDRVIEETRSSVLASLEGAGDDPHERIRASVDAFLRAYLDDPRKGRVACVEVVGVSPELESYRREVMRAFARIISSESDRAARSGYQPVRDYSFISIGLAGAVNELAIECLSRKEPPLRDEVRDELTGLCFAAMHGARAAFERIEEQRASRRVAT